ncbi:MAG: hypothetical protein KDA21_10930, partial [Phycisphaerales bacterium]|nr:hypothetical protein [Phycisphaerales bacterium]
LFDGRPIVITGRFEPETDYGELTARLTGRINGRAAAIRCDSGFAEGDEHAALATLWARARIAHLMRDPDSTRRSPFDDQRSAIVHTALRYNLVSPYTAFVAVDAARRTAGDSGVTVAVPTPVPEGVRYDTTVR